MKWKKKIEAGFPGKIIALDNKQFEASSQVVAGIADWQLQIGGEKNSSFISKHPPARKCKNVQQKVSFIYIVSSNYGWKYCVNIFVRLKRLQTSTILFYQQPRKVFLKTNTSKGALWCWEAVLSFACWRYRKYFPFETLRVSPSDELRRCAVVFNVNIELNSSTCLYLLFCEQTFFCILVQT